MEQWLWAINRVLNGQLLSLLAGGSYERLSQDCHWSSYLLPVCPQQKRSEARRGTDRGTHHDGVGTGETESQGTH